MKRLVAIIAVFLLSGCVGEDKPAPAPAAPPEPSDEVKLLTQIRDALQRK